MKTAYMPHFEPLREPWNSYLFFYIPGKASFPYFSVVLIWLYLALIYPWLSTNTSLATFHSPLMTQSALLGSRHYEVWRLVYCHRLRKSIVSRRGPTLMVILAARLGANLRSLRIHNVSLIEYDKGALESYRKFSDPREKDVQVLLHPELASKLACHFLMSTECM